MTRWYLAGLTTALILLLSAFSAIPMYRMVENTLPVSPLWQAGSINPNTCPPMEPPPPGGEDITVSTVSELVDAVNAAQDGDTIFVTNGIYNLNGQYLRIDTPNVTLRSTSGNRDAVILNGNYITTEIIQIVASNVTIANITLREAYYHPIHIMTGSDNTENTLIYNVHIIDPGQQSIKINPAGAGYPDNGTIACSHIELTDVGRPQVWNINGSCYTGGVDAHQAQGWTIRDNLIEGFWCPSGLSEHGIHMWRGCRDTIVERNFLRNNARGIGFGLQANGSARTYSPNPCPAAPAGYVEHYDGIIRNNFIFANRSELFSSGDGFDSGISLEEACGSKVLHNTVASTTTPRASSIEWRWSNTVVAIVNNLVTYRLWDRGGTASLSGNLQNQPLSLFVNGSTGDLHLVDTATAAIDQVTTLADVTDDFDGDSRPLGSAADIGADEYGIPPPFAVTDLQITNVVTTTGFLTATLHWTPPTNALTTSLRYAHNYIEEGNTSANIWDNAALLTGTLAGSANTYIASLPYSGGIIYFALKTTGAGGESGLSNNAFWPHEDIYLPLIFK